jgi:hypothetical protein
MKVTLESTTKTAFLNGVECRIWEGATEHGVKLHAFIARIGAKADQDLTQFEQELAEQKPPSAEIAMIPLRMIL